ncbi:MAG: nucleoside triphosphate pyrophosphohydrolase [Parashewanella sp.]
MEHGVNTVNSVNMAPLLKIMQRLREPENGCPWDLKQNYSTIVPFTIEEAYEVADVIERQAFDELPDELGDLLFQIIFYCQLAAEEGRFEFADVVERLNDKLVNRHPHVFSSAERAQDSKTEQANWEAQKSQERKQRQQHSVLDDIPLTVPSLTRAHKMQKRAAAVGFDWDNVNDVAAKVDEELQEVMEEVSSQKRDQDRIQDEIGDLLFSVVNLARHLNVEPEQALRQGCKKFERRFRQVEQSVAADEQQMKNLTIHELDKYWNQAKSE